GYPAHGRREGDHSMGQMTRSGFRSSLLGKEFPVLYTGLNALRKEGHDQEVEPADADAADTGAGAASAVFADLREAGDDVEDDQGDVDDEADDGGGEGSGAGPEVEADEGAADDELGDEDDLQHFRGSAGQAG